MGMAPSCQPGCRATCKTSGKGLMDEDPEEDEQTPELVDLPVVSKTHPAEQDTEITVIRPYQVLQHKRRSPFEVEIERIGPNWRTLGLLVSPDDDVRFLVVDEIWEPSLISEWNHAHHEDMQVRPKDIIVSINGSNCNGEEMLTRIQALGKGSKLKLSIRRLPR